MESAAWEVLGAGLRGETSALVSGIQSWSVENAQDLAARFTAGESWSALRGASGPAARGRAGRHAVPGCRAALHQGRPAARHEGLDEGQPHRRHPGRDVGCSDSCQTHRRSGLEDGHAFAGGQGYHTRAPEHLQWMCRFVLHWLDQSPEVIDEALRDPVRVPRGDSRVCSVTRRRSATSWSTSRGPASIPSIVSAAHRRQIRDGLIADLRAPSGNQRR